MGQCCIKLITVWKHTHSREIRATDINKWLTTEEPIAINDFSILTTLPPITTVTTSFTKIPFLTPSLLKNNNRSCKVSVMRETKREITKKMKRVGWLRWCTWTSTRTLRFGRIFRWYLKKNASILSNTPYNWRILSLDSCSPKEKGIPLSLS